MEVACYRIAQEAITNVSRHAGARNCRVRISPDGNVLALEVADDGVGIPEGRQAGVGLSSMRERVEELGGTLAVKAIPTGGTRVLAHLPLEATGNRHQASGKGEAPETEAEPLESDRDAGTTTATFHDDLKPDA